MSVYYYSGCSVYSVTLEGLHLFLGLTYSLPVPENQSQSDFKPSG